MKLDFGIDRKSANFDFINPQNIFVDQIITELSTFSFHYELVMIFSWNPKDFHDRYELYIALWNRTQIGTVFAGISSWTMLKWNVRTKTNI